MTRPEEKTILIVDDDAAIVHMFSQILRTESFNVATAGDGEEAMAVMGSNRPDLILLDLMMPVKGGYDAIRDFQSSEFSGVPIVVISARQADKGTISMIESEPNVVGFMKKPVDVKKLVELCHRILKTEPPPPEIKGRFNVK